MPTIKTIPEILNIAKVSEYLAFNDVDKNVFLKGGALDPRLPLMITCERLSVQWMYDVDPSNPTLRGCANYLFDLLGTYALQAELIINNTAGAKPVITGPPDQSINISGTASFTISVVSALPILSVKWYKNGIEVPGQSGLTYTYPATTANNGDLINAVVTNAAGSTSSRIATLTVTATLTAYLWVGDESQYANILAGIDNLDYQFTTTMTPAASTFDFTLTSEAGNNRWQVVKYPTSWGVVNAFFSTNFNNGVIEGPQYHAVTTIGSNSYICSRNDLSFDPNFPLVFSRP